MAGEEEHAGLRALQGIGKIANLSVERCLVEIEPFQNLEAVLLDAATMSVASFFGLVSLGVCW